MNHATNHCQNFPKFQSKKDLTIKNSEQTFQKKFKLTEKIQKLSSSPLHQRTLSPWTRKRNESLVKCINLVEQNTTPTNAQNQASISSMRHQSSITHEGSMSDFLRKIQFTKRKQSVTTSNFSPEKNHPSEQEKSPNRKTSKKKPDIRLEEMKQLIIYPKQASPVKQSDRRHDESAMKRHKKKQSSETLIATIQNVYDPFQHKRQQPLKYSIPKGMVKFNLKIRDELSSNKTAPFTQPPGMTAEMEKTFRKGSLEGSTNRDDFNPSQTGMYLADQQQDFKNNQIVVNSTQRTFFKTHKRTFSRKSITGATQESLQLHKNLHHHHRNKSTDFSNFVQPQPTYASPTGQAIRRIKLQHKRSRKVKTQVKQTIQKVDSTNGSLLKKDDKEYLYKTFLNYKTQKNSNDHNITKTLNLTFHNRQTFQKNIQKALYLKPT